MFQFWNGNDVGVGDVRLLGATSTVWYVHRSAVHGGCRMAAMQRREGLEDEVFQVQDGKSRLYCINVLS